MRLLQGHGPKEKACHLEYVTYKIGYVPLNVAEEIRALPISKADEMGV